MKNEFLRANLRFLAVALSLVSTLALLFLLLCWQIGGTPYFKEILLGDTLLPILAGLIAVGAVAGYLLRGREDGAAMPGFRAWTA